jgi:hypothetical protein
LQCAIYFPPRFAAKTSACFNDDAIWKNLNSPRRLFLIAGPCVIENEKLCLQPSPPR